MTAMVATAAATAAALVHGPVVSEPAGWNTSPTGRIVTLAGVPAAPAASTSPVNCRPVAGRPVDVAEQRVHQRPISSRRDEDDRTVTWRIGESLDGSQPFVDVDAAARSAARSSRSSRRRSQVDSAMFVESLWNWPQ